MVVSEATMQVTWNKARGTLEMVAETLEDVEVVQELGRKKTITLRTAVYEPSVTIRHNRIMLQDVG